MNRWFLLFSVLLTISCAADDDLEDINNLSNEVVSELKVLNDIGRVNAVKKARQMTDIQFEPLNQIEANQRSYYVGKSYKGMIYSSVKEIGTAIGSNVSFHTFMTAIHNPRSKIYTERINKSPYHGTNCKAYYGTVCSGLVSYALGLSPGYGSYDFPESELMEEIDATNPDNVHIGDVLWKSGHVGIISDVLRDNDGFGKVLFVEVSEAGQSGCRRYTMTRDGFTELMSSSFKRIYRYKELSKNTSYHPIPEFCPVLDEMGVPFEYNDDLCVDKGDRSCYLEDEDVVVNIMCDYAGLEVFKNEELLRDIKRSSTSDVVLSSLSYGNYKARVYDLDKNGKKTYSDFTYWIVVNYELKAEKSNGRLFFSSANAIPEEIRFCSITGSKKYPMNKLFSHRITDEERRQGFLEIPVEKTMSDYPYIHVLFSTEYGKIINRPINWFQF